MKIDIAIIGISVFLMLAMRFLAEKVRDEYRSAKRYDDNHTAKIYFICWAAIDIFSLLLSGVLMYVYVFQ